MSAAATAASRPLRVAYLWNQTIQEDELLTTPMPVTIGGTFPMPEGFGEVPVPVLTPVAGSHGYRLNAGGGLLGGSVWIGGKRHDIGQLPAPVELGPSDYGVVTLGPVAADLQAGTPEWVANTPEAHWFIQLRTVDGPRPADVDAFIASLPGGIDRQSLRVYVRDLGWAPRVGVIYGDYVDRERATRAMHALPADLRDAGAYLRQVRGLR